MYTRAKKHLGKWAIFLISQTITAKTVPQFSSLSRKAANMWADANAPLPRSEQLNITAGAKVWRARGI